MVEHQEFVREGLILQQLNAADRVTVADLAAELGVSAVTIRKDLDALEKRLLLRRVRGGAVALPVGDEGAFNERLRQSAGAKRSVARRAASVVGDGDVIAVDSSTTCYLLAQELLERRDLIVITYGMRAAMLFLDHSRATVVMPGGVLRRASGSMVGAFSDALQDRGRIDKGFFGITTLSQRLGLLELSNEEAEAKKGLVALCDAVYGLFDSSKIDGFGLQSFARPEQISGLFTDEQAGDAFTAKWLDAGVPVTRTAAEQCLPD